MGKYSSSTYRVSPLMKWIDRDPQELQKILGLVALDGVKSQFLPKFSEIVDMRYENKENDKIKEIGLRPPMEFLLKMIDQENPVKSKARVGRINDPLEAKKYITSLYSGSYKRVPKHKYILEGNTYPDFLIETDTFILVGEGKWTEKATTTTTKFLKHRNQMIRHLQGAMEYARPSDDEKISKPVYGIYIVSKDFLDQPKNAYIQSSSGFKSEAIDMEEIPMGDSRELMAAYKGYATWEDLSINFSDIPFPSIDQIKI